MIYVLSFFGSFIIGSRTTSHASFVHLWALFVNLEIVSFTIRMLETIFIYFISIPDWF